MESWEIKKFFDATEVAQSAAENWMGIIADANAKNKSHLVALSGGRVAKSFFSSAAEIAKEKNISFQRVHFFWADERCVPPTDPESNFLLAKENLFEPLNISPEQIHLLDGSLTPREAVQIANDEISQVAPMDAQGNPVLDLVILGMGEDGHVASLFPNATEEIKNAREPFLFVKNSPKPPLERISLSFAAIAAARDVWVLASGEGKKSALQDSLKSNSALPLGRVIQSRSHTSIFTDVTLV